MDKQLEELLHFICARGQWAIYGPGIFVYPHDDQACQITYQGCLELETRGLVYRHREEDDCIVFMPTEQAFHQQAFNQHPDNEPVLNPTPCTPHSAPHTLNPEPHLCPTQTP